MRKPRSGGRFVPLDEDVVRAVEEGREVVRFAAAEAGNARRPCLMRFTYSARNPLVVGVAMCAPSRAVVFERQVPRAELKESLMRRVAFPDLVMYPDALRGRAVFRFAEGEIAVTAIVLAGDVGSFARETDELVPIALELEAVNAALAFAMGDERVGGNSP